MFYDLWIKRLVEKSTLCSDREPKISIHAEHCLPHGQAAFGEVSDEILLHCTWRTYFCPTGIAVVVCLAGVIQFTPAEQDKTMNKTKLNNNNDKLTHQWGIKNLHSKWLCPVTCEVTLLPFPESAIQWTLRHTDQQVGKWLMP